jgi:toxin-antitoxin system PIN domain toxin
VILVDANLLLYAKFRDLPQHAVARKWLDTSLNSAVRFGLPWSSAVAFLRISTNPRVFGRPLTSQEAWRQLEEWLSIPSVWTPTPGERHRQVLADLFARARPTAGLVTDAHLAALAIEHGLTLFTTDGDFARFAGLRWQNPLAP